MIFVVSGPLAVALLLFRGMFVVTRAIVITLIAVLAFTAGLIGTGISALAARRAARNAGPQSFPR